MSDFHTEEKHDKHFALLFGSCYDIERKFNERAQGAVPYTVIRDREEARISSMLHSAGEIGAEFIALQMAAVSAIAIAKSNDEAALMQLGFLKLIPQGMCICPTCLDKAVLACEENLTVLKDIRDAVKAYSK